MKNVLTLFNGMGCAEIILKELGIEHQAYASEVDKFALQAAKQNFPSTIQLGDVTTIDSSKLPKIWLLCGGSPCFIAGTNVICKDSIKPIESVVIGDMVLTHTNTYKKVLAIGGKRSQPIYKVTAQGLLDLRCTSEHPFYVREMKRVYTPIGRTTVRQFSAPLWKAAKDLEKGDFIGYNVLDSDSNPHKITMEEAFIIGRYIADGHTRKDCRTSENRPNHRHWQVILSIGKDKLNDFKENIKENNFSCYSHTNSVYRVVFSSKRLVQLVEAHCGCGAVNKYLSKMLLDLPIPLLEQVINGYISGDGHKLSEIKYKVSTISNNLIQTLSMAIMKVYRTGVSVIEVKVSPATIIEDRVVNQSRSYQLSFCKKKNKQDKYYVEGDIVWQRVKGVIDTNENQDVYNIEVEEDNSYTANGVIVHNCQSFSFAGKMKGMITTTEERITSLEKYLKLKKEGFEFEGQSYLFWEFVRLLHETKPTYFFLENVVMEKKWENIITNTLGVEPMLVDAALVSAQSRKRLFWTNIGMTQETELDLFGNPKLQRSNIKLPKDRGIVLRDILETDVDKRYYVTSGTAQKLLSNNRSRLEKDLSKKSGTLLANQYKQSSDMLCISQLPRGFNQGADFHEKSPTLTSNSWEHNNFVRKVIQLNENTESGGKQPYQQNRFYSIDGLNPCLHTRSDQILVKVFTKNYVQIDSSGKNHKSQNDRYYFKDGKHGRLSANRGESKTSVYQNETIRRLTPTECRRLQSIPDWYSFEGISEAQQYKMLGNGWNVEQVKIFFKYLC